MRPRGPSDEPKANQTAEARARDRPTDRPREKPTSSSDPPLRARSIDLQPAGRRRRPRGPRSASTRIMPALLPGNVQIWLTLIGTHNWLLWHGPAGGPTRHLHACSLQPFHSGPSLLLACMACMCEACSHFTVKARRGFTHRLGLKRAYS